MTLDGRVLNPLEIARRAYVVGETAVDLGLMDGAFLSLGLVGLNNNPLTRYASEKLVRAYFPSEITGLALYPEAIDSEVPTYDGASDSQLAA